MCLIPLLFPLAGSPEFTVYGEDEVKKITTHFHPKDKEASQELMDKWQNFKHNLLTMKRMLPEDVKEGRGTRTLIDWTFSKVLLECHT